ncbi:MAG: 3-phosphoshikimate 1-carboxyvinyltransferase [Anaerolineae bacterium]|nr:3-phosphoshikimate 1-carboxyvinyltransferase [Anaerolineae bacterium]
MTEQPWIVGPGGTLCGSASVPADKSISHRALILGAIATGTSLVDNFALATDCQATLGALRALGVVIEREGMTGLRIEGQGLHSLAESEDVIDCVRSGTTLRLMAGLLAGQRFTSVLTGEAQLRHRPMARVVEPLRRMGATVLGRDGGRYPPLAIRGGELHGVDYCLPVASAQVKSALLLAGLYAEGPTRVTIPGPARDHTERMLRAMGAQVTNHKEGITSPYQPANQPVYQALEITPAHPLAPLHLTIPGDISSAAFLIVAATLVPGSQVTIEGVGVNPTRVGLLDVLRRMGAQVQVVAERGMAGEPVADLVVRAAELGGTTVGGDEVVRAIDELPVLAVAATQAEGETVVRDAAELRFKETDRIVTTVAELRRLGAEIEARPDGFVMSGPVRLRGARVKSHGDHRLAMALAVAGLIAEGETVVEGAGCIADSFPGFGDTLHALGADV